ncbi:MAG: hypothetical protein ABI184_07185 [Ginsengibacter sp.]
MKRSRWYLFIFIIGILLIISGIFTLNEAISQNNSSAIWIRALMLVLWIVFTVSNFFLYKREIRKQNGA